MTSDRYVVPAARYRTEISRVKGSRFIADAIPIESVESAEEAIGSIRRTYHDATHHCFAFRLGSEGEVHRSSDDGEPSGTAGVPILRQIESSGLSDVLVVVTRYFGGTKLGTGGLSRAYGAAASAVLGGVRRTVRQLFAKVELSFSYDDTAPVMRLVDDFAARVVSSSYSEEATLVVDVPLSRIDDFQAAYVDRLGGRGRLGRV